MTNRSQKGNMFENSHYFHIVFHSVTLVTHKLHTSPLTNVSSTLLIVSANSETLIEKYYLFTLFIVLVWPRQSLHVERGTFTAEWLESQGLFTALRCLQWCWTQSGQHARVDYSGIWQHALCVHAFVWMDGWLSVCLRVLSVYFSGLFATPLC